MANEDIMKKYKRKYTEAEVLKKSPFELHPEDRNIAYMEYDTSDRIEIYFGYADATFALIEKIICGNGTEDELIYPLMFLVRHSIEIGLKVIYEQINIVRKKKNGENKNLNWLDMHSIKNIEDEIRKVCNLDERIQDAFNKIVPYLKDYYFDVDEEAFRYKITKGGENIIRKERIKRISIDIVCCKFNYLELNLRKMYFLLEELKEEYSLETHTGQLSREQIKLIAMKLRGFNDLSPSDILTKKSDLMKLLEVSPNQIDKAIKIIRGHAEFSAFMNLEELSICAYSEQEIEAYIELVANSGRKIKTEITSRKLGNIDIGKFQEDCKKRNEIRDNFLKKVDLRFVSCMDIFKRLGKNEIHYSEHAKDALKEIASIEELKLEEYELDDLISTLSCYQSCGYIYKGMNIMGQKTMIKHMDHWLDEFGIKDTDIFTDILEFN